MAKNPNSSSKNTYKGGTVHVTGRSKDKDSAQMSEELKQAQRMLKIQNQLVQNLHDEAKYRKAINDEVAKGNLKQQEAINLHKKLNDYIKASAEQKRDMVVSEKESYSNLKERLENEIRVLEVLKEQAKSESEKERINKKINDLADSAMLAESRMNSEREKERKLNQTISKAELSAVPFMQLPKTLASRQSERNKADAQVELQYKKDMAVATTDKDREEASKKRQLALEDNEDKFGGMGGFLGKMNPIGLAISAGTTVLKGIEKTVGTISSALDSGIEEAADLQANYLGKIDARLQGTDLNFTDMWETATDRFGMSIYVNTSKLMDNIYELSNSGIAWNLEDRALIQTLKDKMVTTFNVMEESLTRLIRLEQADLTYAQLGSEATLNEFLNSQFKDTSYLNSLYDSVTSSLTDAVSQLSYEDSTGFLYTAQKWLGSLYELGMSDATVQKLAQGINYLGTGDITSLNSDSQLSTLFGLAASNAGISYSDILTNGLSDDSLNTLMKSIVDILDTIADNTDNEVALSAWSNITGLSLSDMRAITNLTTSDIKNISNSSINFQQAVNETQDQLGMIPDRTSASERIQNVIKNVMLNFGESVVNDTWDSNILTEMLGISGTSKYASWYLGNQLGGTLGGLIKTMSSAKSLIASVDEVMTNLSSGKYDEWSLGDYVTSQFVNDRGSGFESISRQASTVSTSIAGLSNTVSGSGTVTTGTSQSSSINNAGYTNLANQASQTENNNTNVTNNESTETSATVSTLYTELFVNQSNVNVKLNNVSEASIEKLISVINQSRVNEISEQLYGTINVDVNDSDITTITSTLSTLRGF